MTTIAHGTLTDLSDPVSHDGLDAVDRYALGAAVARQLLGGRHASQGTEPAARGPRKTADEMSRERTR